MKLTSILTLAAALATFSLPAADNQLTAGEKAAGWKLLFNGKNLDGWRGYMMKGLPEAGWEINGGLLKTVPKVKGKELITVEKFGDFELSWEWKIAEAGNNGIKYFVSESRKAPGPEYQMLDDAKHPDGGRGPIHQTASFYDVLPPAADKPLKAPGEWNSSRIIAKGNHVEHWLNGKNVLTFELDSAEVKDGIAKSKFKSIPDFGTHLEGHIMLTYHNDECWYRSIKLRELK
ncbi:MAG: DUF1080 domain-containing protein [Verrucomicrobia bacterium]|nr:DUF1080 domain-containing protein [Verrucomicrobiota bacterium]